MSTINYKERYKDALERAKELIAKWKGKNKDFYIEDYSYIFPELAESEDERMQKGLIQHLKELRDWKVGTMPPIKVSSHYDAWIAHLEGQKESIWTEEDEIFRKHILPRILNPTGWTLEQVEADRELLKEFVERQKNKWVEKQKEQKPWKVGENAYFTPDKETPIAEQEQKPVEIHIDNPNVQKFDPDMKVTTSDSSADGKELPYVSNKSYNIGFRDGVASVKPVEPSNEELIKHQKELYNFKVFAAKQAKEHHISFVHDFEWNNFCAEIMSYFNQSVEWSEEDEKIKERLITRLNWITYNTRTDGTSLNITFFDEIDWLKSLPMRCPKSSDNWKPSEEQNVEQNT